MKNPILPFSVAAILAGGATPVLAIDLYVDKTTKQLFAESGPNRIKLGTFEKVEDQKADNKQVEADKNSVEALRKDWESKRLEIEVLKEHVFEQKKDAAEVKLGEKGIEFESADGNFKAAINGRLQVDSQVNVNGNNPAANTGANTTNQLADGVNLRRARLGIEGSFYKNYEYKFEYDFSRGNGTATAGITDAFVNWKVTGPFALRFGQFKEPFSLEEATSNRFLTFIERNQIVNSFSDNPNAYKVGIGANYALDRLALFTAFQTETIGAGFSNNSSTNSNGNNNRNNGSGDTGWDFTGRIVGRPWYKNERKFLHIGSSGSYRSVNNNYTANGDLSSGGFSFTSTPDGNVDRTAILNTGNLTTGNINSLAARQVSSFSRFGLESAVVYGPFSAQAEYIQTNISGRGYGSGETLEGYYGYVSYFLTGESRAYKAKTGAWDRIKPTHRFGLDKGWGAWEVALGYDRLNLNDNIIQGGEAQTLKAALNWYPHSHMRLMANFVHVLDIDTARTSNARSRSFNNTDLDLFEMRAQVDW
ncbi:MAG: porin [Methylococcaceae bacterium]|jgi:phosphate-selective porin OprO/OprP